MLYECQHSVYIWKIVESWLGQKLTKKDIFTSIASKNKNDQLCINNIVSELQYLLYKFLLLTYKGQLESTKMSFVKFIKKGIWIKCKVYTIYNKYNMSSKFISFYSFMCAKMNI